MPEKQRLTFLLDVDNTLLDNDRVQDDLRDHLAEQFGMAACERYWAIFEEIRRELGYADYLGALQRYRASELRDGTVDPHLLQMSAFLIDYPFAQRVYPQVPEVIEHLHRWGPAVILSDGDVVFQPRKIQRSGLWRAVHGRVLIYIHKELMLADVERRFPAAHYVMVDDKLRILAAMKNALGATLTTVFPRQGHYAHDSQATAAYPAADLTVERIGELLQHDFSKLQVTHG